MPGNRATCAFCADTEGCATSENRPEYERQEYAGHVVIHQTKHELCATSVSRYALERVAVYTSADAGVNEIPQVNLDAADVAQRSSNFRMVFTKTFFENPEALFLKGKLLSKVPS